MTLQEWEDEQDAALDTSLTELFRASNKPRPSARFVSRTIGAVRGTTLPAGRRALRRPWVAVTGWVVLISAAAMVVAMMAIDQPFVGAAFANVLAAGIRIGLWLIGMAHTGGAVFGVFARTAGIVAKAVSSRDATIALTLLTAVSALSLSMLNRLLFSQKESSSW